MRPVATDSRLIDFVGVALFGVVHRSSSEWGEGVRFVRDVAVCCSCWKDVLASTGDP